MTPDPVAKLARFTPAPSPDAAELLFAAGRASARTHWLWKASLAGLLASNVALGALFVLRSPDAPTPQPVPAVQPVPEPPAPPATPPSPARADDPWSYRTLRSSDPERQPAWESFTPVAPREPLTALSGRNGELD